MIDLEGEIDLRRAARGPAAAVPARWPTPGARRSRRVRSFTAHPGRDPRPRRAAAQGAVEPRWCRSGTTAASTTSSPPPRLRQPLLPPPRGVRPGRLRHRRLGHRLPQLDAGDPARRRHQLRRGPAPRRRRRRAAAAAPVAPRARADGALAAGHHAGEAARRRAAPGRHPHRARGRRPASRITDRWGDTREYPAVLVTCQSWLLTTHIDCDESLFSHRCGWRSTAPATCSRPRPSSWSTGRSGRSATPPPAATG